MTTAECPKDTKEASPSKVAAPKQVDDDDDVEGIEPTQFDVLCGKSQAYNKHRGNKLFKDLIRDLVKTYHLHDKAAKMQMTREMVESMKDQCGARFLQKNKAGKWVEMTDAKARDKISHALRSHKIAKKRRREEEQEEGGDDDDEEDDEEEDDEDTEEEE